MADEGLHRHVSSPRTSSKPLYAEGHDAQSIKRWVREGVPCAALRSYSDQAPKGREAAHQLASFAALFGALSEWHYIVLAAHRG